MPGKREGGPRCTDGTPPRFINSASPSRGAFSSIDDVPVIIEFDMCVYSTSPASPLHPPSVPPHHTPPSNNLQNNLQHRHDSPVHTSSNRVVADRQVIQLSDLIPLSPKRRRLGHEVSQPGGSPLIMNSQLFNSIDPSTGDRYASLGPYSGNYSGGLWNAQGLFHSEPRQFYKKRDFLFKHLRGKDFWLVSELHGDAGMSEAFQERLGREGYRGFWSHYNRRRAGVGIIVKKSFLDKFKRKPPEWIPVVAGEVGCLRLFGEEGDLDIYSIYLPTGNQAVEGASLSSLRDHVRTHIGSTLRPYNQALSILGGDFNYVTDPEDRYSKETMSWSGGKDEKDQKDWVDKVEERHRVHEIYQPMATHSSGRARSRLDRVYSNHHVGDQLDARYGCACLDWAPHLSHHRPVTFFRFKHSHIDCAETSPQRSFEEHHPAIQSSKPTIHIITLYYPPNHYNMYMSYGKRSSVLYHYWNNIKLLMITTVR